LDKKDPQGKDVIVEKQDASRNTANVSIWVKSVANIANALTA
jgi:hypothetical protein